MSKAPERFRLPHVKDAIRELDGKVKMPAMGNALMDFKPILRAATGLRYYFIEQEGYDNDAMEELKQDADYVSGMNR